MVISDLPALDVFEVSNGECHLIEGVHEHQLVNPANFESPPTGPEPYLLSRQIHRHFFEATSARCQLFHGTCRERHWHGTRE